MTSQQKRELDYPTRGRKAHATTRDYLEYLDERLGVTRGTLYDLCMRAVKSKAVRKAGVTVTYRGLTEGQRRLKHVLVPSRKRVFLLEFKPAKTGKQHEKVVQVHLEL